MTNDELKEVFYKHENVIYEGHQYILYRITYSHSLDKRKRGVIVGCDLIPINGANSMISAAAKDVQRLE